MSVTPSSLSTIGPNMIVQGAYVDCQKGRYAQGIAELEKVLRSQGYTVPPPN